LQTTGRLANVVKIWDGNASCVVSWTAVKMRSAEDAPSDGSRKGESLSSSCDPEEEEEEGERVCVLRFLLE
jgi:hypothetical protein